MIEVILVERVDESKELYRIINTLFNLFEEEGRYPVDDVIPIPNTRRYQVRIKDGHKEEVIKRLRRRYREIQVIEENISDN